MLFARVRIVKRIFLFRVIPICLQDGQPVGFGQPGGSRFYVAEKLAPILAEEPKPEFLGAIVLDSIMNYNDTDNSQILPIGFDQVRRVKINNGVFCLFRYTLF